MGRKKIKKSEQVIRVNAYVKRKHEDRLRSVITAELNRIKLEELTEETKEIA